MALIGMQLGHYTLTKQIGSGGMGEVYLAEDTRINQQVAIKVSRSEVAPCPDAASVTETVRLFQREARAIAQLDHPNILPLFSYGEEQVNGALLTYIVMPYRKEGSLVMWLRQRSNVALLTPQDIATLVTQAADALQYAHNNNIIHQDVKPSNFLVRSRVNDYTAIPDLLLTDFGIAKLRNATSQSSHAVRGTASYMAPEQWGGNPVPASDQYALAVMVYELLTGKSPFRGSMEQMMYAHLTVTPQPPTTLNPRLNHAIDAVILRALAKNPADRFPSIAAFANAFRLAVTNNDEPTIIKPLNSNFSVETASAYPPIANVMPNATTIENKPVRHAAVPEPTTPVPNFNIPQLPPTQRRGPDSKLFVLVGLALVVILAGFGVYFVQNANPRHTTSTSVTQNTGTPTQRTRNAAATAQNTNATATAKSLNPYPPAGAQLALNDPLSDNSKGMRWETKPDSGGICTFVNGAYQVTESQATTFEYCPAYNSDFSNFAFEVHMQYIAGDAGGLFFTNNATHEYFYFDVNYLGDYMLRDFTSSSAASATMLASGFAPAFITGAHQTNVLAVVVSRGLFKLYINKQLISTASDPGYHDGEIGVFVRMHTNPTEIIFSNVKVWTF